MYRAISRQIKIKKTTTTTKSLNLLDIVKYKPAEFQVQSAELESATE